MHGHHGEREALKAIEQELAKSEKNDSRRDTAMLKAILAIGRITFARFDNTDQQLDRIEEALAHIVESAGDQASIDALAERLKAADAKFDAATGD